MITNLERYKKDLERLIAKGALLHMAIQHECYPDEFKKTLGAKGDTLLKTLPKFQEEYQIWYSEAKIVIKQLLPDRLADFIRHYEKPKSRKDITFENYQIEDYLQGLHVTRSWDKEEIVGPYAAIPHFRQQQAILNAVSARFESSLYDIHQLVQADLFDSELKAAFELLRNGFIRASGAMAGVILEKHLTQVLHNHNIKIQKKNPTICDLNDLLKNDSILDIPTWRQIQRLGDIRNLCDHNKDREPTKDEVQELITGTDKITKTLF
jgi:hypothetical protein